jgi:hypothetical protein
MDSVAEFPLVPTYANSAVPSVSGGGGSGGGAGACAAAATGSRTMTNVMDESVRREMSIV